MCSILGIFDLQDDAARLRPLALSLSRRQRHRGPDASGIVAGPRMVLVHERLAVIDPASGAQPLTSPDGRLVLAVNGEIYNHRELAAGLAHPYAFRTGSDCEVILPLYQERGPAFVAALNGIFAFALWDGERDTWLLARDPLGVCPLYTGRDEHGHLFVASEMKALVGVCRAVEELPPGSWLDGTVGEPVRYYRPAWRHHEAVAGRPARPEALRGALEAAVERQSMSDVSWGALLSGGLDSSLVAALAQRAVERAGGARRIPTFSIGLAGSPDLAAARRVAAAIGTDHRELLFTLEEGLDALSEVIYHVETYDVTTVRASTPMYLMARRIRSAGVRMVLSGEGADEIFGGYLYFHRAPDAAEFHAETVRKLDLLHKYDCLRANKSMAAWGVEARVPFLDLAFLDVAMGCDAEAKRVPPGGMEKHLLRSAFAGVLPDEVLWRQKEQFSDGVGYGWIDALRAHAAAVVSDRELAAAGFRFPVNTPASKEAYLYRSLFAEHFPGDAAARLVPGGPSIACSTPAALAWDPSFAGHADPSGRSVVGVHRAAAGGIGPAAGAAGA
jgi:asparagine synthase (glutamine-hydrolysing)